MPITTALFDLDGTLIDSSPGIRRCVDASLIHHGLAPVNDEQFASFIGPPLTTGFALLGADDSMIDSLVTVYREHYGAGGMFEYSVYDGVPELLDALRSTGVRLGVATSKVTRFARPVVEHAGLAGHFEAVVGAERDGAGAAKPVVIADALERLGVDNASSVVMIGDREHDGHGAASIGTAFIGVSWGFGSESELLDAGAHHIASHPREIESLLRSLNSVVER